MFLSTASPLASTASIALKTNLWTASLISASIARKMSTTTTSWEMKHKKTEPKKWAKILPQSWRVKMANKSKPKISVLNLHGTIMASQQPGFGRQQPLSIDSLEPLINKAFLPKKLEAVFLSINSPGGSPVQSELIADYISQKSKEKSVPVIAFVEDMAASGGYWLATAAPTIYVSQSSLVGSIGVISQGFGFHETIAKLGIERRTQTAGESKDWSDPFKAQNEEDKAIRQKLLDALHINFKNQVKNSRGDKLKAPDSTLFNGHVWVGQEAVELGLVDGIDTIHRFVAKQFGTDKVTVEKVSKKKGPLSSLFGANFESADFSESPFTQAAFAHQVATAFTNQGKSPYDDIRT